MPDSKSKMHKDIGDSLNILLALERVFSSTKKLVVIAKENEDFLDDYSFGEILKIDLWEIRSEKGELEIKNSGAILKVCERKLDAGKISECNELLKKELEKQEKLLAECRRITEILEKGKPNQVKTSNN